MANFVCDICGGAIKMQANKTGVCQGCGMEYDIEAIRDMAGQAGKAAATVTPAQTVAPIRTNDNELDRDSLLIYLNDIRVMETIIHTSEEERKKGTAYLLSHGLHYPKEPLKPTPPIAPENGGKKILCFFVILCMIALSGFLIASAYAPIELKCSIIAMAIFLIIYCVKKLLDYRKENKEYNLSELKYNSDHEIYTNEMKAYEDVKKREYSRYYSLEEKNRRREKAIQQDINRTTELLNIAYNANIIPAQFRTIEGVYYLYNYLSTSNQTLSEALMQANLEAIKQKIDNMIRLQSAQIIEQAQTNARLSDIQDTNNRILATAQQNAKSSALAAKYAAITAVNTSVIAQLGRTQLAYQRAEFWLK